MLVFELIKNFLFSAITDGLGCTIFNSHTCPGASFNAITAAFATQGIWVQADILEHLQVGGLVSLPILLYVLAAAGGLISMALGAPPKMYLWFFMGPPIYHWLIQTTWPVHGVRVNVGNDKALYGKYDGGLGGLSTILGKWSAFLAQTEVWKLAEPGLVNTNIAQRRDYNYIFSSYTEPREGPNGDGTVNAAFFFVYFDNLVSGFVGWLSDWTGVYNLGGGRGDLSTLARLPGTQDKAEQSPFHMIRDLKWRMLEDITSSRLTSANLRDAFVSFMSSECGDVFATTVDQGKYVAAMNAKGDIPRTVFKVDLKKVNSIDDLLAQREALVGGTLSEVSIPTPDSLWRFLYEPEISNQKALGSFDASSEIWSKDALRGPQESQKINERMVSCDWYLRAVIDGFRWEAGHIYYQLLTQLPPGVTAQTLVFNLFYGWPMPSEGFGSLPISIPSIGNVGSFGNSDVKKQQDFLKDLILVHLVKNEMAIAPQPYITRKAVSQELRDYTLGNMRSIGSKARFGELYSWALMLPYLQGLLLYLLTIAYPIVCCFIVMPGFHKILFTWMSFFFWAKLWDFGFAVVSVLERSVWATIGNRSEIGTKFERISELSHFARVDAFCAGNGNGKPVWEAGGNILNGSILGKIIGALTGFDKFQMCSGSAVPDVRIGENATLKTEGFYNVLHVFDSALTLSGSLDLDLSNSFYIYIMAAMYFAIPALTGQLVLGAKAGAASFINTMIGSQAQEAGRAASSGYTGEMANRIGNVQSAVEQQGYLKALRQGGFAAKALEAQNKAAQSELAAQTLGEAHKHLGEMARVSGLSAQGSQAGISAASQIAQSYPSIAALGVNKLVGQDASALAGDKGVVNQTTNQPVPSATTKSKPETSMSNGASIAMGTGNKPQVTGGTGGVSTNNNGKINATGQTPVSATGQGGGGGIMSAIGGIGTVGSAGMSLANVLPQAVGNMMQLRGIGKGYEATMSNLDFQARTEAAQAGMGIRGFGESATAKGMSNYGGRMKEAAELGGRMGSWSTKRDWAQGAVVSAGYLGLNPGSLNAGPKPVSMEGNAIFGDLGSKAQNSANFFDPGSNNGFFNQAGNSKNWLESNYGEGQVLSYYNPYTLAQALGVNGADPKNSLRVIGSEMQYGAGMYNGNISGTYVNSYGKPLDTNMSVNQSDKSIFRSTTAEATSPSLEYQKTPPKVPEKAFKNSGTP